VKNPKQGRNQEPYLFFISDLKDARAIAHHYLKRWKIECCFKHLKRNGFNAEDINLKEDGKIELMIGVLACIFLLSITQGLIQMSCCTIKMKIYKTNLYPEVSIFRRGYDALQRLIYTIPHLIRYLEKLIKQQSISFSYKIVLQNV
jgi:hypothetical protein